MHRVNIKAKGVSLNNNRELVLQLLDKSLEAHGLKEDGLNASTTLVTPQAEENAKSMLKRIAGKAEEISAFKIGAKGKVLAEDVLEMDDVGKRLLQEVTDDWIDALDEAGFNANDMEKFEIKSMRILIAEIYIRLVGSALRKDNKLPATKGRAVWMDVTQKFVEKLIDDQFHLKIDQKFDKQIKIIHIRWAPCIRAVVSQLNEVELARTTISGNIAFMHEHQMQVMRYLIAGLHGKENAKNVPYGSLADRQLPKTLERAYKWKISEYAKKKKKQISLIHSEHALIISGQKINNTEMSLNLALERQMINELISEEDITRQNTVLSFVENDHIKQLIGLLNLTKMIMGLVERIANVVELGGWVPILLNMMDFEEVDKLIDNYIDIYKYLIDPTADKFGISGTNLYKELGNYAVKECRYDRSKIQKMKDLQAEELLKRIKDKLSDAYLGVMRFGKVLNCKVVPFITEKMPVMIEVEDKKEKENPAINEMLEASKDKMFQEVSFLRLERMYHELIDSEDVSSLEEKKPKDKSTDSSLVGNFLDRLQKRTRSSSSHSQSRSSNESRTISDEELAVKLESLSEMEEKVNTQVEDLTTLLSLKK